MRLIAEAIRILHAKFHCNRPTTVQDIQDYVSLTFGTQCRGHWPTQNFSDLRKIIHRKFRKRSH